MSTPIDADALYAEGTLRAVTLGLTRRYRREGRFSDVMTEVAAPIMALGARLKSTGNAVEADQVIAHAVHDGVPPSMLAEAVAHSTVTGAPRAPAVTVDQSGALVVGVPPPATDLASAIALVNYLREVY
jgi:hypothetical protein